MLFSVGENYERGAQVFGVAARLLFGLIGIDVRSFCLQDAESAAFSDGPVVGSPALAVEFETYSTVIEEIPAAFSERLVEMTGEGESDRDSKEEFGRHVEATAEAFDVVFVEFALAAENLGDDAGRAEDSGEVFLKEAVLVHEELEDFERLGARKLVVTVLEILDQEGQEFGKLLLG